MNKSNIIIIILSSVIIFGAYKFIFQGNTIESKDARQTILLSDSERNLILEEMRAFLVATQQIVTAISKDEMTQVVTAAKKVGRAAQASVPSTLVGKLPLAFKKLGFDTHSQFDKIAIDAQDMEDKEQTLKLLSKLMQNCIACHSNYRLAVEDKNPQ